MIKLRSVKAFCCDDYRLIENYDEAINSNEIYDCHHRFETDKHMSVKELKDNDLYYGRPASELIFLTHSEHAKLHHPKGTRIYEEVWNKGLKTPEEVRKKQSKSHIGLKYPNRKSTQSPMKGKHHSDESKEKNRLAHLGRTPWNKGLKKGVDF